MSANPFRDERDDGRQAAPPCTVVIFGASGDLANRKLLPALWSMAKKALLPAGFAVLGVGRTKMDDEGFREMVSEALKEHGDGVDDEVWEGFAAGLQYITARVEENEFMRLRDALGRIDEERGTEGNRLYYLAVPPQVFGDIVRNLKACGLAEEEGGSFARIVIEKPFGFDLPSARDLNDVLHHSFHEDQVFRIDHYLGKETVQNLLVLRFANGIFEPIWNRRYVDHVQITVAETLGIEDRATFYEETGALRDIVQNHLLQVLATAAMEPPVRYDADSIRAEKLKVLRAVRRPGLETLAAEVVRGQYGPGTVAGDHVRGYREEEGVDAGSATETFVAWRVLIDNWRWAGVPFYARTGKRLPKRVTEIAVQFRQAPHSPFAAPGDPPPDPNLLVIRVQPEEGITLRFGAKVPVPGVQIRPVTMEFLYGASFLQEVPDAYERLILDAMLGDATLFPRDDEVEEAWELVTPIMECWAIRDGTVPVYEAGTWGPQEAHRLIEADGRRWRRP